MSQSNLSHLSVSGQENLLTPAEVAARGIHVDAPTDHKDYLHRSGRTARAGEAGVVVVLATTKQ